MVRLINSFNPELVFIEFDDREHALKIESTIHASCPKVAILGFNDNWVTERVMKTTGGYLSVIPTAITLEDFSQQVEGAMSAVQSVGPDNVIVFIPAKAGSGARTRAWKLYLQALSDETGMAITVCHYPPGTSKWNKIEHRLFSFISLNWKGKPLINFETVVNLIGGTRTSTGLKVKAVLDTNQYDTSVEVSKDDIDQLRLKRHKLHPDWNYTLLPRS